MITTTLIPMAAFTPSLRPCVLEAVGPWRLAGGAAGAGVASGDAYI